MTILFAYIDPFTGSLILQLLVMAFATVMVFFRRVKAFVLGLFGIKTAVASIEDTEDNQTIPLDEHKDEEQQQKAA